MKTRLGIVSIALGLSGLCIAADAPPTLTPRPEGAVLCMDYQWLFNPAPPEGFGERTDLRFCEWRPIRVPGEWVMQGFTVEPGKAAGYARRFTVEDSLSGKRLKLRFDAVFSECTVWVNGQKAGYHLGGLTPFELDITDFVKPGPDNLLMLAVTSESLADTIASASQYAVHPLGGIIRKVTLLTVPSAHLS